MPLLTQQVLNVYSADTPAGGIGREVVSHPGPRWAAGPFVFWAVQKQAFTLAKGL